jgi:hypothetical protein
MSGIPKNLTDLVASGEELAAIMKAINGSATAKKKPRVRSKSKFVMFPDEWDFQLARVRADGCAYRVAIHLLREAWRSGSNRVKLANVALEARGVGRHGKRRALDQLVKAGLITVERQLRKSPMVTIKFTD